MTSRGEFPGVDIDAIHRNPKYASGGLGIPPTIEKKVPEGVGIRPRRIVVAARRASIHPPAHPSPGTRPAWQRIEDLKDAAELEALGS